MPPLHGVPVYLPPGAVQRGGPPAKRSGRWTWPTRRCGVISGRQPRHIGRSAPMSGAGLNQGWPWLTSGESVEKILFPSHVIKGFNLRWSYLLGLIWNAKLMVIVSILFCPCPQETVLQWSKKGGELLCGFSLFWMNYLLWQQSHCSCHPLSLCAAFCFWQWEAGGLLQEAHKRKRAKGRPGFPNRLLNQSLCCPLHPKRGGPHRAALRWHLQNWLWDAHQR